MSQALSEEQNDIGLQSVADSFALAHKSDVLFFNGLINLSPNKLKLITERSKQENVLLILVTPGGDPDSAYRLARCLQNNYKHFTLFVSGYCKSAGTLIALGANELVFSEYGELGPLDVQMSKKDDLMGQESGLTVMNSLQVLQDKSYLAFEKFLLQTANRGGERITLATSAEIATKLTTGLFSQLYAQIDPMHIGEAGRAISIATHYGERLLKKGQNFNMSTLKSLILDYPSHGFVIDQEEAATLFENVRSQNNLENMIAKILGNLAINVIPNGMYNDPMFEYLSSEMPQRKSEEVQKEVQNAQSE